MECKELTGADGYHLSLIADTARTWTFAASRAKSKLIVQTLSPDGIIHGSLQCRNDAFKIVRAIPVRGEGQQARNTNRMGQ
ncbi:hypothetical protein MASR2M78_03680 [Treponema sp.]